MTKYKVVTDFHDSQDENRLYEQGNSYPKPVNKKISDERIEELSTKKNKHKKIFIEKVEEQD